MLNFYGIGAAFNPALGNNSAYIKQDGALILLDCGSSTFERAIKDIHQADPHNIHIFITHTHTDHIGSLGTMLDYISYALGGKAHLYFPCDSIIDILTLSKVQPGTYVFNKVMQANVQGMHFNFSPVPHVGEHCYAILIKDSTKTILYGGDSSKLTLLDDFLQGNISQMYLDVCDGTSPVHLGYNDLLQYVPNVTDRNRIYLMHLNNNFDTKKAIQDGFNIAPMQY